jgi:lysophospholipid acyltransferase
MCAVHASGISYSGEGKFERVKTCDPWKVETTYHLREKISNWNMSSELWLRKCIYERSPFKNKQIGQAYTFVISSFWHGFYGGYYLSFGLWFLQINLATKVFKFIQLHPNHLLVTLFTRLGFIGKALIWILVNFFFSHNGLYFQILDSYLGLLIMKRLYFMPPLIIVGLIWFFGRGNKDKRERKEVKQEEEAGAVAHNPEKT